MNKTEALPAVVEQANISKYLLALATAGSEAEAEGRLQKLQARSRLLNRHSPLAFVIGLLASVGLVVAGVNRGSVPYEHFFPVAALAMMAWFASASVIHACLQAVLCHEDSVEHSKPISGTEYCVTAADYIRNCPAAAEWRRFALTRRDQLRRYDVKIMEELASFYKEQEDRKQVIARYEAACKEVHNVERASPST